MFSHVYRRSLQLLGVELTDEERRSNQLIWRYNATLLGVREDLICASLEEEEALYAAITRRQFEHDIDSIRLAHAVLHGMAFKPPFLLPPSVLFALGRRCVGPALADALELPDNGLADAVVGFLPPTTRVKRTVEKPFGRASIWSGKKLAHGILRFGLGAGYRDAFGRSRG